VPRGEAESNQARSILGQPSLKHPVQCVRHVSRVDISAGRNLFLMVTK